MGFSVWAWKVSGLLSFGGSTRRYARLARSFADGDDKLWTKFFSSSVVETPGCH